MDVDIPSKRQPRPVTYNFAPANPLGKANAPEFENQNPGQIILKPKIITRNLPKGTRLNYKKGGDEMT